MDQTLGQWQQQRLQQILAPQMRQSLEFLQAPLLELRSLIQRELEQNPTLEEGTPDTEQIEIEPGSEGGAEAGEPEAEELDFKAEYEKLAQLDDEWRDYFQQVNAVQAPNPDAESRRQFFLESLSQPESLQEHLLTQLGFIDLSESDREIARLLIGSINDDGYLNITLGELAETTGIDIERLERLLSIIQDMDPVGVGARDLRECLLQQLERLGLANSLPAVLVRDHLEDLGARRFSAMAQELDRNIEEVQRTSKLIATLEPKPGRAFSSESANYVTPEVFVQKTEDGHYTVTLDRERLPRVRISRMYRRLLEDPSTPKETRDYIREKIRGGVLMIRSIHQRQDTIRRIAEEIVAIQSGFLDHGVSRLRPLTMSVVAEKLGVHETTVSRAIANKYMQTPRGLFEMKYFFRPGFQTRGGDSVSNLTIRDRIRELIEQEDPAHPLSDQALADRLKKDGARVARRTVAKYREALKIFPSHLRRA